MTEVKCAAMLPERRGDGSEAARPTAERKAEMMEVKSSESLQCAPRWPTSPTDRQETEPEGRTVR